MKQFFFFLFIIQVSFASAQKGAIGEDKNATIEAYDLSGERIPLGDQLRPQGNKMLSDQFVVGEVKFIGDTATYHLMVNFSLFDNELFFKKDSTVLAFVKPVNSFSFSIKNDGVNQIMNFKRGYPNIGANSSKSFYQIVTDGPRIQLLKYRYKVIHEKYNYGGPVQKEYVDRDQLFIYDIVNKTMSEIGTSIKSIKKSLPVYTASIEQFATQNKIKNEEDVTALISFINQDIAAK